MKLTEEFKKGGYPLRARITDNVKKYQQGGSMRRHWEAQTKDAPFEQDYNKSFKFNPNDVNPRQVATSQYETFQRGQTENAPLTIRDFFSKNPDALRAQLHSRQFYDKGQVDPYGDDRIQAVDFQKEQLPQIPSIKPTAGNFAIESDKGAYEQPVYRQAPVYQGGGSGSGFATKSVPVGDPLYTRKLYGERNPILQQIGSEMRQNLKKKR